jgi:DNA-binding GntR family transcriptional regulator
VAVQADELVTAADAVHRTLRRAIMAGELLPGHRLLEVELAKELAVSRTPIREAFRRLATEGLVRATANRGVVVHTVTLEEASHVYAVREALETLATRLAARHASSELVEELEESLGRAELAALRDDHRAMALENNAFHDRIARASGNPVLGRMLELLRGQIDLVRVALWSRAPGRPRVTLRQHRRILQALRQGKGDAAAAAARLHLRSSWAALQRSMTDGTTTAPVAAGRHEIPRRRRRARGRRGKSRRKSP